MSKSFRRIDPWNTDECQRGKFVAIYCVFIIIIIIVGVLRSRNLWFSRNLK